MNVTLTGAFPRDSVWLPVPFDLTGLTVSDESAGLPDAFAYVPTDQTVTSRTSVALSQVQSYSAAFNEVSPTVSQLTNATAAPAQIVTNYGQVPTGVPAIVGEDARNVTANATNDYQRALDLQSFFRDSNDFTYDPNTGYGYGYQAMARFLQQRRGFCQHFAATMAMMAREIGIPSRVVVGFLAPSRRDSNGTYVFTSHDAHAWPELYFGGVGWVRFEPTPGNGAVIPPSTHLVSVPRVGTTVPTSTGPSQINHATQSDATTSAAIVPKGGSHRGNQGGAVPPLAWLVVVVVIGLALTPAAIRWGVRRSRMARAIDGGESCEYAWLELRDRVVDLRLPWTGSLTPRARRRFVEPLLGGDPDGVAALDRLSLTVERSRYAGSPLPNAQPSRDARAIMAAIGRGADRKQRVKAFLWPTSLMPKLQGGWQRFTDRLRHPHPTPTPLTIRDFLV